MCQQVFLQKSQCIFMEKGMEQAVFTLIKSNFLKKSCGTQTKPSVDARRPDHFEEISQR